MWPGPGPCDPRARRRFRGDHHMRAPLGVLVIVLALATCPSWDAHAQDAAAVPPQAGPSDLSTERPRIGLVLSGGGARGIAEIGVLKELERLRIPVDCIAGTSMGAIIGGLYSSGMSACDLERALVRVDWQDIFNDRPPRRALSYQEKQDDARYLPGFEISVTPSGLRLPSGVTTGGKMIQILESLSPTTSIAQDFDDLPIPFRCIATDIETGDEVVLRGGWLAQAMRASASFPAVFSPVEINGRLLVDGGVVDNLPVDVAKAMGAGVVIAVDVGTPRVRREALSNGVVITAQAVTVLSQRRVREQEGHASVVIRPSLDGYPTLDFAHIAPLVQRGEVATRALETTLRRFSVSEQQYDEYRRGLLMKHPRQMDIQSVQFAGTTPEDERLLRKEMRTTPGAPMQPEAIQKDLLRLYNSGDYSSVNYQVVPEGKSADLQIRATPNALGPVFFRLGFHFSSDFENHSEWGVLAGLRWTQVNARGAEWRTDADIGLNRTLVTEFHQPFAYGSRWFVAPTVVYSSELQDRYLGGQYLARYRAIQSVARLDFGVQLGPYGTIRVGPQWGHAWYRRSVGADLVPSLSRTVAGINLQGTVDQLDDATLPSRGYALAASTFFSMPSMGAYSSYKRAELKWSGFLPVSTDTLYASLSFGSALGSHVPPYDWFRLGGWATFAGYQPGELVGPYYAVARMGYLRRLGEWPTLIGEGVYLALLVDGGNVGLAARDLRVSSFRYSGTVALGTATRLGLLYVGISQTTDGKQQLSISIGQRF